MDPGVALTVCTRWTSLAALAAVVGGVVMAVAVCPPGLTTVRRRLARWNRAFAGLLLVATAGELLLRTRTMAGGGLGAALRAAPAVLARTHFGPVWAARAAMLLALLALVGRRERAAGAAACVLALATALTASLVGHAADRGDLSLAVAVDFLHVVAAATWVGGLFCLALVVLPGAVGWPRDALGALLRRFSTLAGWCLGMVVGTGVYNAWALVASLHGLVATPYGRTLLVKLGLVAGVAGLGAASRVIVRRSGGAPPAAARLRRTVGWESALALGVLLCTAMLTESEPPRHATHVQAGGPGRTRGSGEATAKMQR